MTFKLNYPFLSGRKYRHSKGFTLIEALVVSGIIIMMLALVLPEFRLGERQFALRRAAGKIAQDLRKAQGLSMSAAAFSCGGQKMQGYGLYFESSVSANSFYVLQAKCSNGVDIYIPIESISLEKGVKIKELKKDDALVSALAVFFYPPDPRVDLFGANEERIILSSGENTLTVKVNKAGLINVE